MSATSIEFTGRGGEVREAPAAGRRRASRSVRAGVVGGVVALALGVGGVVLLNRPAGGNTAIAAGRPVTAEVLEKQYGAKIQMVGILAAGGLIELRLQVVDKDKAMALFGPVEKMPMLAVEGTSKVLESAKGMKHHMTLLDGGSYFMFYANAANVVHEGSMVSMVINGVRLEHIVVQK
jgi:hypothetical protein